MCRLVSRLALLKEAVLLYQLARSGSLPAAYWWKSSDYWLGWNLSI